MTTFSKLAMACLFAVGLSGQSPVWADDCDPLLLSEPGNPLGYRQREGRCEGLYIEQVASTSMLVASLTAEFQDYDPAQVEALSISWPAFEFPAIHLRAKGTRWRLYYRMDAVHPISDTLFQWPTGVLDALNARREDIGVVGWVTTDLGGSEQKIYLPLRITTGPSSEDTNTGYRLVVVPSMSLQEIYVSVASTDSTGKPKEFTFDSVPLQYGYYPAHRALEIPLQSFTLPGLYYIELGAQLTNGGASSVTFLMYHTQR